MIVNAPVHNSCAPEVSPEPNRETVAIFYLDCQSAFLTEPYLFVKADPGTLLTTFTGKPDLRTLPNYIYREF